MPGLLTVAETPPSRTVVIGVAVILAAWLTFCVSARKANHTFKLYDSYAQDANGSSWREMYESKWVEYPPLAIGLMSAARGLADVAPSWSDKESLQQFGRTFCLLGLFVQALVIAGVWRLLQRLYPEESQLEHTRRVMGFVICSAVMTNLIFHRLDAIMAALVLGSLALLLRRRWVSSFLVLAVAVNFKLTPAALFPLWVVASLPSGVLTEARSAAGLWRLLRLASLRTAAFLGLTVAVAAPFYALGGGRSLAYFSYHSQRGIQCESAYGAVLSLLALGGHEVQPQEQFGSWELHSSLSPTLTAISTPLLLLGLAAAFLPAAWTLRRRAAGAWPAQSVAEADGGSVVAVAVLLLMVFAGLGKVFSPQYVLWVLPLMPLLPLDPVQRMRFQWSMLAACILTRLAFPVFVKEMLPGGPAPLTALILTARAGLWLGLAGWLGVALWRSGRPAEALEETLPEPAIVPLRRAA